MFHSEQKMESSISTLGGDSHSPTETISRSSTFEAENSANSQDRSLYGFSVLAEPRTPNVEYVEDCGGLSVSHSLCIIA
jgi:hypothetical protein